MPKYNVNTRFITHLDLLNVPFRTLIHCHSLIYWWSSFISCKFTIILSTTIFSFIRWFKHIKHLYSLAMLNEVEIELLESAYKLVLFHSFGDTQLWVSYLFFLYSFVQEWYLLHISSRKCTLYLLGMLTLEKSYLFILEIVKK